MPAKKKKINSEGHLNFPRDVGDRMAPDNTKQLRKK